jgi:hypothetical protein
MDDAAFLTAFESCTLPKEALNHLGHVRMAFLVLGRNGDVAAALQRYVGAHGLSAIYNETLTRAWVRLVEDAMLAFPAAGSFEALLEAAPRLRDPALPLQHYSRELLFSEQARGRFVQPDLAPLP